MPYKRHEAVSEAEMRRQRYSGHHTICQTLREVWEALGEEKPDIPELRMKLRLGVAYAKAMNEKLKWYKAREENGHKHEGSPKKCKCGAAMAFVCSKWLKEAMKHLKDRKKELKSGQSKHPDTVAQL